AANLCHVELLRVVVQPIPLLDVATVAGAPARDVQCLAAMAIDEVVLTARLLHRPLLVVAGVTIPLSDVAACARRPVVHIEALATIDVADAIPTAAHVLELELLRTIAQTRPDLNVGSVLGTGTIDIHALVAVHPFDLVDGAAR